MATFWNRVHERYLETASPEQFRSSKSIVHRWGHIQNHVSKFCGCFDQVTRLRASGTTEVDRLSNAVSLFLAIHKKPFILLHCWRLLRGQPKWMDVLSTLKAKSKAPVRSCASASGPATENVDMDRSVHLDDTTPSQGNDSIQRPPDKKATKKRSREGTEGSFQVWVDELRTDRRESTELSSKLQEQNLSVEMEMVAIKKDKVRMQENELQFKRDKLELEQKVRREEIELEHEMRREQLLLEKKKCEREDNQAFWHNTREEKRIMAIDCTSLTGAAMAYYTGLQDDILQKRLRK